LQGTVKHILCQHHRASRMTELYAFIFKCTNQF